MVHNSTAQKKQAQSATKVCSNLLADLAKNIPGFRDRPGQRQMALAVADTLSRPGGEPVLACEAPTGIGKGFAYLAGGVAAHLATGKPIVIATGTVLLQEQLINKDIPAFLAATGLDGVLSVALAKGIGRYACLQRITRAVSESSNQSLDFGDGASVGVDAAIWPRQPKHGEVATLKEKLAAARDKGWHGELDNDAHIPPELHGMVQANLATCLGQKCPDFASCGLMHARRRLWDADIIVANHDLVLAHLKFGEPWFAGVGESLWVFDEAHLLPEKARAAFAGQFDPVPLGKSLDRLMRMVAPTTAALSNLEKKDARSAERALKHITEAINDQRQNRLVEKLSANLRTAAASTGVQPCRFPVGKVPEAISQDLAALLADLAKVVSSLKDVRKAVKRGIGGRGKARQNLANLVMALGRDLPRLENAYSACALAVRTPQSSVSWIEVSESGGTTLCAAPVAAGAFLRKRLWEAGARAILTSATLRACGSFKRYEIDAGLADGIATTLALPSPFALSKSSFVVLSKGVDPNSATHHETIAHAASCLVGLAPSGSGILIVATSWVMLKGVRDALAKCSPTLLVQAQGDAPKSDLIARHKKAITQGKSAILLGVSSFAEGLDLPGNECRAVLLGKLPFKQPDDPISAGRAEYCEARGGQSFRDLIVPETSRKLVQICGRLVRTELDAGVICVMDPRLVSKAYGKTMMKDISGLGYATGRFSTSQELQRLASASFAPVSS